MRTGVTAGKTSATSVRIVATHNTQVADAIGWRTSETVARICGTNARIGATIARIAAIDAKIDGTGGANRSHILQTAYRRSDLIESIHGGSFFGDDWTKLGLFLPAGLVLLLLWLSGLWMWWVPFIAKGRRKVAKATNLKVQAALRYAQGRAIRSS
jgi:uncharacterized iron-regulated membrane protein